jgi:hypothetical protein
MTTDKESIEILKRGIEEIIPEKDFLSLLKTKKKINDKSWV